MRLILVAILVSACGAPAAEPDWQQRAVASLAKTRGTQQVPGLHRPVRVQRDSWGVAHGGW